MIITGYQGVGKSTLAKKHMSIIDLESSSFWKYDRLDIYIKGDKTRPDDWYVYYCQVAEDLSSQGYTVFVSCNTKVREFLSTHSAHGFCAIFPIKELREKWLEKLRSRYEKTKSEKDLKAYEHAEKFYDSDIDQLWYECQYNIEYYTNVKLIENMDYNLMDLVYDLEKR